jgi:hypothetical protein
LEDADEDDAMDLAVAADDRPVTLATIEVDGVEEVDASAVSARLPARRSMMAWVFPDP